jgi:hypothetical protein
MLARHRSKGRFAWALLAPMIGTSLPAQAADPPPRAVPAEKAATTSGPSPQTRAVAGGRFRTLRHVRAVTVRRCAYLGCPGNHALGVGF